MAPFAVASVYATVGEGPSPGNCRLIRDVLIPLIERGLAWMIGADWNMDPEALWSMDLPRFSGSRVIVDDTGVGTCTSGATPSVIDYFLVSAKLAGAIVSKEVIMNATIKTHRPFEIQFLRRMQAARHVQVVRYKGRLGRWNAEGQLGPTPAPQSWERCEAMVDEVVAKWAPREEEWTRTMSEEQLKQALGDMSPAYDKWLEIAREELVDQLGVEPSTLAAIGGPTVTKLVSTFKGLKSGRKAPKTLGNGLRWVSLRTREMGRLVRAIADSDGSSPETSAMRDRRITSLRAVAFATARLPQSRYPFPPEECKPWHRKLAAVARRTRALAKLGGRPQSYVDVAQALDELAEVAEAGIPEATKAHNAERREKFQEWVSKSADGGSGILHRSLKASTPWAAKPVKQGESVSAKAEDLLEAER